MKSKIWPPLPRKWPLDLKDLGRSSVTFFLQKNTFLYQGKALRKMSYTSDFWRNLKEITGFQHFIGGLEDTELKTGNAIWLYFASIRIYLAKLETKESLWVYNYYFITLNTALVILTLVTIKKGLEKIRIVD